MRLRPRLARFGPPSARETIGRRRPFDLAVTLPAAGEPARNPHWRDADMPSKVTGTWNDDPAHFRRPSRRGFLHVGLLGALGLGLDDFFRLRAGAAETKDAAKEPKAQSVIHIFLPGG